MPARYDLHSHSTCSDGSLTPAVLVDRARRCGVTHLALTDHDTTAGLRAAAEAARGSELTVIAGVEISSCWEDQTVHILGLGIDPASPVLNAGLERQRRTRCDRSRRILANLDRRGIHISRFCAGPEGGLVTRTHIARALVEAGYARSLKSAFATWLKPGRPGHTPAAWPALTEAVRWIRHARGQAVLAHPLRYRMNQRSLERLVLSFQRAGGRGIEVVSGSSNGEQIQRCASLAARFQLLGSVGSDFHGPDQPWLRLGCCDPLPGSVEPVWGDGLL